MSRLVIATLLPEMLPVPVKRTGAELPCPIEQMNCVRVLAPQLEGVSEKTWYRPGKRARALAAALQ